MNEHSGLWDRKDLARRLRHALDVAGQVVERLGSNGYTDRVESANSVRPEKVIAETAVLLLAASTAADDEVRACVRRVSHKLIPLARTERTLLGICMEPALALDYAQAHICLDRLGYPDRSFDELLHKSISSQVRVSRERPPHRVLEQEWMKQTWNHQQFGPRTSPSTAARESVLNRPMDVLNGTRDDVYAFTHGVMYVRDFNIRPQRLPRGRADILAEAEAALGRCLDEQDYDLGAEVLLSWPLTGESWSAAAVFGFRVLARVEDEAGFLPTPNTRVERLNTLRDGERTDYLLATSYHTVYVMGLLCATALQPGRIPPAEVPATRAAPGSADAILRFVIDDGGKPHWRGDFDRLDRAQRDAVAGLLLGVAFRRKIRQRDFGSVHELLSVAFALGLADTPAASQAAEMLERLSTFAELRTRQKEGASGVPVDHRDGMVAEAGENGSMALI